MFIIRAQKHPVDMLLLYYRIITIKSRREILYGVLLNRTSMEIIMYCITRIRIIRLRLRQQISRKHLCTVYIRKNMDVLGVSVDRYIRIVLRDKVRL